MFVDPGPSDSEECNVLTNNINDYSDCIERVITRQGEIANNLRRKVKQ